MFFKQVSRSLFVKFLGMLFSLYSVRVQLDLLGAESYAIWAVIFNIVNWILILDFGLGNSIRNKLVDSIKDSNWEEASILINKVYRSSLLFGLLFSFVYIFSNLYLFVSAGKVDNLFAINFIVGSFIVVFAMLPINQILHAFSKSEIVILIQTLITTLGLVFVLLFQDYVSLNIISIIYGVSTFFVYLGVTIWFFCLNKKIHINIFSIPIKDVISVIKPGVIYFVFQVNVILIFSSDRLIISNFYDFESVVSYDLLMRYFNLFIVASVMISNPVWSSVRGFYNSGSECQINAFLLKLAKIQAFGVGLLIIMCVCADDFISLWVGNQYHYDWLSYNNLVYFALLSWGYSFYSLMANVANGLGENKIQLILGSVSVLSKIPITLFLIDYFDDSFIAVVLATTICLLPFPLYFICYLMFRKFR
ncbi:lipopolysaccharide biosynthesis protein [Photobacterium lipolyticum]|uniref:Polysaccharide biosynthesis protein n=1 Tax=Photobacterium lipolyticum TaxID=266810 RepID=A0A2T3MV72_9GAMM|nr:hypothetical protein [Photobacterium lipolyticum]PSW03865.1 hypothetical protein C9I89_15855 [Photobacterium lipolyticum]